MAAEAAEAELRAKGDLTVAELKSQLAGRYGEIEMKDRAYARVFTKMREAHKELKKKNEQLMAQESELSALRARLEAHEGSAEPGFPELHADSHGHDVEQLLITHGTLRNRRQ